MFAFFWQHKCVTMSLKTILGSTCRRIGLCHAALSNSGRFDGNPAGYCSEHKTSCSMAMPKWRMCMSLIDESALGYQNRFRDAAHGVLSSLRKRNGCNLLPYQSGRQIHTSELLALKWQHRFEARSKGRSQGDEDVRNHYRKGRSGDWTNYFTPNLKKAFKNNYPGLMPQLGYAASNDWCTGDE